MLSFLIQKWKVMNFFAWRRSLWTNTYIMIYQILKCNLFQDNVPFLLYHLKTSENPLFSDVFRKYRKGRMAWNGLRISVQLCVSKILIIFNGNSFRIFNPGFTRLIWSCVPLLNKGVRERSAKLFFVATLSKLQVCLKYVWPCVITRN